MKKYFTKKLASTKDYLIHFTQTQLAVTLVSLPILVTWGLGFSWMTFLGNLVYAPVLTLFLIISSLLLFTELIGIPNHFLVVLLNVITHAWDKILHYGYASWIVECAKPPTIILISIPIITFFVLHHRSINTHLKRFLALSVLLVLSLGIFAAQKNRNSQNLLSAQLNEKLYVIKLVDSPSIILVDNGFFARKKSVEKAIDYEVKQWINKMYGQVSIRELRILKPSAGSFKAAQYICSRWNVQAVWLAYFKDSLNKGAWFSYFNLKRFLEESNIEFKRYEQDASAKNAPTSKRLLKQQDFDNQKIDKASTRDVIPAAEPGSRQKKNYRSHKKLA